MGGVVEPVSEPYLTIGGIGNDVLIGTFAGEKLRGFAGDDVLDGRGGLDSMYGDAGNDILYYRPGALISGGADIDTLRMDYTTRSTAVSLNFTATNLLVTGIEVISGALSSHNDVIRLGAVTGGDFNASYYEFRNINAAGLVLSGTPTISSLNNGNFELAVNGGTLISLRKLKPRKQVSDNQGSDKQKSGK